MIKFADDVSTVVPENTGCGLEDEFSNIVAWSQRNKLQLNLSKTKEIVFHRPSCRGTLLPTPLSGIERVNSAKLLGITITSLLKFAEYVNTVIQGCSASMFLLRTLKSRGLSNGRLEVLFHAFILSRIRYALSAWGGYVSSADRGRIDVLLKKCKKFGYCSNIVSFEKLLQEADSKLFKKICSDAHCLNQLLPSQRPLTNSLRMRGHPFSLPSCTTSLFKMCFINRVLFTKF